MIKDLFTKNFAVLMKKFGILLSPARVNLCCKNTRQLKLSHFEPNNMTSDFRPAFKHNHDMKHKREN